MGERLPEWKAQCVSVEVRRVRREFVELLERVQVQGANGNGEARAEIFCLTNGTKRKHTFSVSYSMPFVLMQMHYIWLELDKKL